MTHIIGDNKARLELKRTNSSGGVSISMQGSALSIAELLKDATRVDEIFKEALLETLLFYTNAINKDKSGE